MYTDGAKLEVLTSVKSLDGDLVASILKDDAGRVFYSVTEKDVLVIEPSMLGIITVDADFTKGSEYVEGTTKEITDEYTLLNGKHDGDISDKCNEYSFTLKKDGKELTVNMRVYDEGIAYNYAMSEGAAVKSEASEFVFKDESVLWYGVNNVGHSGSGAYPKYSLLNEETIKTELQWANSIGIKGVKVDYYEKDNQNTMKQMYLCAKIAAENKIMVLFHGCTNPGGENRTFPNVLSYEAVYGAEYYKWRQEPSTANIITYLFTRNVVGSADFTPTALPVAGVNATHGFMLGTSIYVELVSGENTIKFYNDESFAPNIDRIALSKSKVNATISVSDEEKDIVENSPGAEYEYTMYEAEKAVIGSGATNEGHMVGWLGGTAYVEFNNINVETAGTNTIKVSNPKGYAPNLDKIGVSVTTK